MKIHSQPLPGAFVIEPRVFEDARGVFIKTFHAADFAALSMEFHPQEEYFSTSHRNVLRGLHFQLPPHEHEKFVYCIRGAVLDVILDLRRGSQGYGKSAGIELTAQNRRLLFLPKGLAHGFLALEDNTVIVCKTSTVHALSADAGIRWDSFGFSWPVENPVLSERDRALPALAGFNSPFA